MDRPIPVARLSIYSLAIPLRQKFRHAAAERVCAEPIVVALELADHTVGYGETHPRTYVTGESPEDAIRSIHELFVPKLLEMRPANFGEAIEAAANLPLRDEQGRVATAARAAIELAVLDAYSRAFGRSLESLAGWFEAPWLGSPGSHGTVRYGVVVSGSAPKRVRRFVHLLRLAGIRDFKVKVGDADDDARLEACVAALGRGLERGRLSLRVDANGAWGLDQAAEQLRRWERRPISCVEQPLAKDGVAAWGELTRRTKLPLMADESLVTPEDAEGLISSRGASWFNIRISKNGGLIPSIRLAVLARKHGVHVQLGCMVGETSILSAAGRLFLQMVPNVRFAEGSYGKFLLCEDVVSRPVRFSWGGHWPALGGPGLGMVVAAERLERYAVVPPVVIPF